MALLCQEDEDVQPAGSTSLARSHRRSAPRKESAARRASRAFVVRESENGDRAAGNRAAAHRAPAPDALLRAAVAWRLRREGYSSPVLTVALQSPSASRTSSTCHGWQHTGQSCTYDCRLQPSSSNVSSDVSPQ